MTDLKTVVEGPWHVGSWMLASFPKETVAVVDSVLESEV